MITRSYLPLFVQPDTVVANTLYNFAHVLCTQPFTVISFYEHPQTKLDHTQKN